MAISITNEDRIKELEQLKADSVEIQTMIDSLQKSMKAFNLGDGSNKNPHSFLYPYRMHRKLWG